MRSIFSLTVLMLVISCGDSSGGGSEPILAAQNEQDLQRSELTGTWEGECIDNQSQAVRISAKFSAEEIEFIITRYLPFSNDVEDCKTALYTESFVRSYAPQNKNLLMVSKTKSLTPLHDVAASTANERQWYGFTDWKSQEVKDTTGKKSTADSVDDEMPNDRHSLEYEIEGDILYIGNQFVPVGEVDRGNPMHKVME